MTSFLILLVFLLLTALYWVRDTKEQWKKVAVVLAVATVAALLHSVYSYFD